MTRQEYVLAVLTADGGQSYTPVQVQQLFFLLDKKIPERIGGPRFAFAPYDYGPFDGAVYGELEALARAGRVAIRETSGSSRTFGLTPAGAAAGRPLLESLDPPTADYVRQLSEWVRGQSFTGLVSAIYRDYPEMSAHSVFRG